MRALTQFRRLGLPRCSQREDGACGRRLIWPWQEWVCDYEEWPEHHACHHVHIVQMWRWSFEDARESRDGYRTDLYDECRFCQRPTSELAA